ncbi:MAG: FAD-binding oxidoreductase, partial [Balneolaceae bacterium]
MDIKIKTLSDKSVSLSEQEVNDQIRMIFRGSVLTPDDDGYEEARVVENLHINRKPGMIIRCTGTADVMDAVKLARERELL